MNKKGNQYHFKKSCHHFLWCVKHRMVWHIVPSIHSIHIELHAMFLFFVFGACVFILVGPGNLIFNKLHYLFCSIKSIFCVPIFSNKLTHRKWNIWIDCRVWNCYFICWMRKNEKKEREKICENNCEKLLIHCIPIERNYK